jgi:primosomal protein N' (replication factor Y)
MIRIMYAAVIPAIKLPRDAEPAFDYAIPEDLADIIRRGSWVKVPWRGRTVDAVVATVQDGTTIAHEKTKPCGNFVGQLPEEWLAAVERVAETTVVSTGTALHAFLPPSPKRAPFVIAAPADPRERPVARASHRLVRIATRHERDTLAIETASAALAEGRSAIIIVPHASDLALADLLRTRFGDTVLDFHGGLAPAAVRRAWQQALAAPVVIVGTRLAAMAPARDLGAILVLESDSGDLRQYDQNPRYDARDIARFRAERVGASLTYAGHAIRIEEHAAARQEAWSVIEADTAPDVVTVSAGPGDDDPLAAVASAAEDALQQGKKVLIFHNRRGSAGAVLCADCGTVLRCDRCGLAFALHGTDGLQCHRCGTKATLPAACAKCGGTRLRKIGFGTETITDRIAVRFPEARLLRVDSDAREPDPTAVAAADVLIGTQALLHDLLERYDVPLGVIIASSADDLLARPGFRSRESAWATVRKLKDLAAEHGATLFLRTVDPANAKLAALHWDSTALADAELSEREAAGYPPFSSLYGIHAFGATEQEALRRAGEIKAALASASPEARVIGPLRPSSPYVRGRWKSTVAAFVRLPSSAFIAALRNLPDEVIIDTNPESLQ